MYTNMVLFVFSLFSHAAEIGKKEAIIQNATLTYTARVCGCGFRVGTIFFFAMPPFGPRVMNLKSSNDI